jgi:hypothetical protein
MTFQTCLGLLRYTAWCSLFFVAQPIWASDATGSFTFASCSFAESYRIDLSRFQKKDRALTFKVPETLVTGSWRDWLEVPGEECTASGHCEIIMKSKIRILHVSPGSVHAKKISGDFEVLFSDGRKREGSFSAKFAKPSTQFICM